MKRFGKILCMMVAVAVVLTTSKVVPDVASAASKEAGRGLDHAVVLYIGSPVAYVNNAETKIDPQNPGVVPVMKENRTLVPVRFVAESLGLKVLWDEKTATINIEQGTRKIKMVLGSDRMLVENEETKLEVPAESINDRTFIPLRALSEALGKKVFYDRGLIILSNEENIFDVNKDKEALDQLIARVNKPPVIGTKAALKSLLSSSFDINRGYIEMDESLMFTDQGVAKKEKSVEAAPQALSESAKTNTKGSASTDYSTTNAQVQGVDEADVVKTDGEYIYQVNRQRIIVAKAFPADALEIVSTVGFDAQNMNPQEIYVDHKHMVVIGSSSGEFEAMKSKASIMPRKYPPTYRFGSTKAVVYDITDKRNIQKIREIELEGNYISSRKIGSSLYMVSNKNISYWIAQKNYIENSMKEENNSLDQSTLEEYTDRMLVPSYRDSAVGNEYQQIDYSKICYFPDSLQPDYMTVAVVNLDKPDQKAGISTYLGAGQHVYASRQSLYVAVPQYGYQRMYKERKVLPQGNSEATTLVYKFSLTTDTVTYLCKGEVPGTILNQFSMDENGRYFRIATTRSAPWRSNMVGLENNVYVLNDMLSITGKLENLAPGEKIYSVRFMGDRGYVVTFKTVDPLFVIDLKDAANPKVLGALKIPGYSDYLHPYDENHIIGFGKDTVEVKGNAFYLGMKMAVFNVSDVTNPKELFTEKI
ncbi:MAG: beta-propeller domain-containing protein, partial [Clostridia bacterium]|nr:beta-propeller domain-containing protein [Clostridia bacterium]